MSKNLYLKLYHGRMDPGAVMSGWGTLGPVFLVGGFARATYAAHIIFDNITRDGTSQKECFLRFFDGMLYYDGVYYGDWLLELIDDADLPVPRAQDFDPNKAAIPPGALVKAPWVDSRGLDAETLVEVSAILFGAGLADYFDEQADRVRLVYDTVQALQDLHVNTDWDEHGDYWGAVDAHCRKVMEGVRATNAPSRPDLLPITPAAEAGEG
jgi:hypothetical protein